MGEVYRAVDTQLKRDVAIKVLPDTVMRDHDPRARFQREAELLASLNHPHIAQIYGVVDSGGQRALVMELVEGPTLADRIARKAMSVAEALAIAMQIAEALEAAHAKGIIHRDLKPANIKLGPDGAVKVLDFGLAKALGSVATPSALAHAPTATSPMATQVGTIMGTAAYMSPEQSSGAVLDERSDVWSLGCVVFEMLSGRPAFGAATVADTMTRVRDGDPDWGSLPVALPEGVRRVLRRCLQKAPNQRLHAAADVRIALEDALAAGTPAPPARVSLTPWVIASVAILASVLVAWPRMNPSAPDLLPSRLDISTPLTLDVGSFALSPDGRQLAFVALEEGTPYLWLRHLDDATPKRLADTDGARYPFWSPDSQSVAFFAHGLLKRIGLDGGSAQIVAHARNGLGGAWSGDVILYSGHGGSVLLRVPAMGGKPVAVTRMAPGEVTHRFPAFLPDGRRFVFRVGSSAAEQEGLHLGSLDTPGVHRRIAASDTGAEYIAPGSLVTVRGQSLIAVPFDAAAGAVTGDPVTLASDAMRDTQARGAFSVSASGVVAYRSGTAPTSAPTPVWIDRKGQPGEPLSLSGSFASLARDGRHAAVVQQTPSLTRSNTDIWIVETNRGEPRRFTFDAAFDINPVWSRDGGRIAFASNRQGVFDLFEKPVSFSTDERLLLASRENKFPNDWSPDGHILLYVNESADTGDDVWAMPIDDPSKTAPVVNGPYGENQSQFSPDGRWIAYRSNESGRFEIYMRPYPGAGSRQLISRGGGIQPRWRADGRELYYISGDSRIMAVPIRLPSGSGSLEVGTPAALFPVRLADAANQQYGYSVDASGQRFLVSVDASQPSTQPITVLQNWQPARAR